jgi:Family of unknown function (DUF6308)
LEGEVVKFRLPEALQKPGNDDALTYLRAYYEKRPGTPLGYVYSGARFDDWDSTGTRSSYTDRFTSDDLLAITFLSVQVPPKGACELLAGRPGDFNRLLADIPHAQDLAEVPSDEINPDWAPWRLWEELRELRGVDWVIASKLLARKRPQLIPIYDRVVKTVTGGDPNFWAPLCDKLREDKGRLHRRLLQLRNEAALPPSIPALRIFDVIAWMEGRRQGL